MFSRSIDSNDRESLVPLAEAIADAFERIGDQRAADGVLELASRHGISDGLALRQAEQAFAAGDANRALDVLIPAWEAGSMDLHLEAQMGLAAFALGLYDVVETLTAENEKSLAHRTMRWVLAVWDDLEVPILELENSEVIWAIRAHLMTLAACGRTDIVFRVMEYVDAIDARLVKRSIVAIPATRPAIGLPAALPMDARAPFAERWQHPAHDAVFNWAFSSARQVFEGERVAVLAPDAQHFSCLLGHAQVTYEDLNRDERSEDLAPGQFEHVIAIYEPNRTLDPAEAIRACAKALTHEGQLHLLVAGPGLSHEFDLSMSLRAAERLCTTAGLRSLGADSRDATGLPVAAEEAVVHLVRAEKRIV